MIPAGIYSLDTIYNIFFIKPTNIRLEFIVGLLLFRPITAGSGFSSSLIRKRRFRK